MTAAHGNIVFLPACLPTAMVQHQQYYYVLAPATQPKRRTMNHRHAMQAMPFVFLSQGTRPPGAGWVGRLLSEGCAAAVTTPLFFLLLMLTASSGSSDLLLAEPELEAAAAASSGNRSRERGGWSEERENSTCVPLEISTVSGPERQHS